MAYTKMPMCTTISTVKTFLQISRPFEMVKRTLLFRKFEWEDGIQYFGFKYYPRHEGHKDPPYEPSKLFRIQLIKHLKHRPSWEKHVIKDFGLGLRPYFGAHTVTVVKNTPEVNAKLYKIKHLISIKPITFPNGFPKDEKGTMLLENGELVILNEDRNVHDIRLQEIEKFKARREKLDGHTLKKHNRYQWNTSHLWRHQQY